MPFREKSATFIFFQEVSQSTTEEWKIKENIGKRSLRKKGEKLSHSRREERCLSFSCASLRKDPEEKTTKNSDAVGETMQLANKCGRTDKSDPTQQGNSWIPALVIHEVNHERDSMSRSRALQSPELRALVGARQNANRW
jgi:hypothetical protein